MLHPEWSIGLRILLALHIAAGSAAFVCAPVALAVVKGGRTHRFWGKIYFWSMAAVAATAMALSIALPILFLALVAVFSFYSAFIAYRVLYLKDLPKGRRVPHLDWAAALITCIASAVLFVLGFVAPTLMRIGVITIVGHSVSIVSIVFGWIGMQISGLAMRDFLRPPKDKMFWWYGHMQGMIGSYIAALTAFSSVNLSHYFGSAWWVWLWPTMVGVPLMLLWTAYYKRKFNRRATRVAIPAVVR